MRRFAVAAVALAGMLAITATSAFATKPIGGCMINTNLATGVQFGAYDPLAGTALSTVWSVSWWCPYGQLGYQVSFSGGNSGNPAQRWMTDGLNEQLRYNLYLDAGFTQIWGDGTNGTQVLNGAPSNKHNYTTNIYGLIPGGQSNVSAYQSFGDSITATVNF